MVNPMPKIADHTYFNGTNEKLDRLGLRGLWDELQTLLVGFELRVAETKDSNGGAAVREMLDARFRAAGGWGNRATGGVDWIKCRTVNGTQGVPRCRNPILRAERSSHRRRAAPAGGNHRGSDRCRRNCRSVEQTGLFSHGSCGEVHRRSQSGRAGKSIGSTLSGAFN